jgi:hypothetical protein
MKNKSKRINGMIILEVEQTADISQHTKKYTQKGR